MKRLAVPVLIVALVLTIVTLAAALTRLYHLPNGYNLSVANGGGAGSAYAATTADHYGAQTGTQVYVILNYLWDCVADSSTTPTCRGTVSRWSNTGYALVSMPADLRARFTNSVHKVYDATARVWRVRTCDLSYCF